MPGNLLKAVGIDGQRAQSWIEMGFDDDAFRAGGRAERLNHSPDERLQQRGLRRDLQAAANDTRDVEQVLDEPRLCPARAFDGFESPDLLRGVELPAGDEAGPPARSGNSLVVEALAYLGECEQGGMNKQDAWTQFCLALFASTEFHYVD